MVNCRIFPGVVVDDVKVMLLEVGGNDAVEIEVLGEPLAAPASPLNEEVSSAIGNAVESLHPGTPIIPYMAPYGTDGKETRNAGMPTYGVMGIFFKPEDEFTHGLNERVQVDAFFDALEFWYVVMKDVAGD